MATPTRWAPWTEPVALMTGSPFTVSGTATQAIPGAAVTVVPHVNTRLSVSWTLDAECTVPGNVVLICRLLVNAVAQAPQLLAKVPTTPERRTTTQCTTVDLVAGTSYLLGLDIALSGTGATFSINPTHTHLGPIVGMPNLTS